MSYPTECTSFPKASQPVTTTESLRTILADLGSTSSLLTEEEKTTYNTLLQDLFQTWTEENISSQISNLTGFLSLLGKVLSVIIPELEIILSQLLAGSFLGYLGLVSQLPDPSLQTGSFSLLLQNLNLLWFSILLPETERGVEWARETGQYSFPEFPQYNFSLPTDCHGNYNGQIGQLVKQIFRPQTKEELSAFLKENKNKDILYRITSEISHSFNDFITTDGINISTHHLQTIHSLDTQNQVVHVSSGTHLKDLNQYLFNQGYALADLGNWDYQTVAGAIATGTHGSNSQIASSLTDLVTKVGGYDTKGKYQTYRPEDDDFKYIALSLGSSLLVTDVWLKVVPAYSVQTRLNSSSDSSPPEWLALLETEPMTELDYYPLLDKYVLRRRTTTSQPGTPSQTKPLFNKISGLVREVLTRIGASVVDIPGLDPLQQPARQLKTGLFNSALPLLDEDSDLPSFQGLSNNYLFGTSVPFSVLNSEYFAPFDSALEFINVMHTVATTFPQYAMVFTYRTSNASSLPLAPHYNQKTISVDVGIYHPNDQVPQGVLDQIENIYLSSNLTFIVRPHWGKHLQLSNEKVYQIYSEEDVENFLDVCRKNDVKKQLQGTAFQRIFNRQ